MNLFIRSSEIKRAPKERQLPIHGRLSAIYVRNYAAVFPLLRAAHFEEDKRESRTSCSKSWTRKSSP